MGDAQSTFIANGYAEEIEARVSVNKALYKSAMKEGGTKLKAAMPGQTFGVEAYGKTEYEYQHIQQIPGFVRIPPDDYLGFDMIGMDGQVFVSISAGEKVISDNFPVRNGGSLIVDAKGYVRNAKPGKIWTDCRGKKHSLTHQVLENIGEKQEMPAIEENKKKEKSKKEILDIEKNKEKEEEKEKKVKKKEKQNKKEDIKEKQENEEREEEEKEEEKEEKEEKGKKVKKNGKPKKKDDMKMTVDKKKEKQNKKEDKKEKRENEEEEEEEEKEEDKEEEVDKEEDEEKEEEENEDNEEADEEEETPLTKENTKGKVTFIRSFRDIFMRIAETKKAEDGDLDATDDNDE